MDIRGEAARILRLAKANGMSVTTVESCTAGLLAHALASAPGAAGCFHGGFVTYTKPQKIAAVGVPADLLKAHTAVSAPVARAMATGGLQRSPADLSIAITGVAGPEPDEDGNPVGLVYVAVASKDEVCHQELHLGDGPKQEVCEAAMLEALRLAERLIQNP